MSNKVVSKWTVVEPWTVVTLADGSQVKTRIIVGGVEQLMQNSGEPEVDGNGYPVYRLVTTQTTFYSPVPDKPH